MEMKNIDETMRLDQDLYQLASYDVTHGMIIVPHSLVEVVSLQEKVANRFNYFKRLIRTGECTFEFIKQNVLRDNGPFVQKELSLDDPDFFNKLSTPNEEIDECEYNKAPKNFVMGILKLMTDEIKNANKDRTDNKGDVKTEAEPFDVDLDEFWNSLNDKKNEEDEKMPPKKKKEEDDDKD